MGDAGLRPGGDTRSGVVGGDRVVDVDYETSLVSGVLAGNLGGRAGSAGARTSDRELGAADVVLRAFELLGSVQGDVLSAHQVFTSGEFSRQVQGEVCNAGGARRILKNVVLVYVRLWQG